MDNQDIQECLLKFARPLNVPDFNPNANEKRIDKGIMI